MSGRSSLLCLITLSALAARPAAAQDSAPDRPERPTRGQPTLQQTLRPPEQPLVGQPITMTVEIVHPANTQVLAPDSPDDPRVALLTPRLSTQVGEQGQRTTLQLDWMVWRPGQTTLPPLEITVVDDAGQALSLRTQPETLRVGGQLEADKEPALSGPLGPLRIFRDDQRGLIVLVASAAGGLILLGVAALLYRRLKPEIIPAAPKPAHQQALDALQALAQEGLVARGEVLAYYERLSEIVRDYLGRRYGFPGTELTSSEILARLTDVRWPAGISEAEIKRWLQHADMVKFAGERPDQERAAEALRQAFSIVELTRPTIAQELIAASSPDSASADAHHAPQDAPHSPQDAPHPPQDADHAPQDADHAPIDAPQQPHETKIVPTDAPHSPIDVHHAPIDAPQQPRDVPHALTDAPQPPASAAAEAQSATSAPTRLPPPPQVQDPLLRALLAAQDEEEEPS